MLFVYGRIINMSSNHHKYLQIFLPPKQNKGCPSFASVVFIPAGDTIVAAIA